MGLHFPPDVQVETTEEDSVLLMHPLLAATKDPLAMDPPVANRPKKSKTKKAPNKAVTDTIPVAPSVPSVNVITINKPTYNTFAGFKTANEPPDQRGFSYH